MTKSKIKDNQPLVRTGAMCLVRVFDPNDEDRFRHVDLGDYWNKGGERVLLTSQALAEQYGHLVDCPIYVRVKKEKS